MHKRFVVPTLCAAGIWAIAGTLVMVPHAGAQTSEAGQASAGPASIAKLIGAIKAINGDTLTLAANSGPDAAVTIQPNARILKLAPGGKDLKSATAIQLQDLQIGDTVRVRGTASENGKLFSALEVIVITKASVAAVSDQLRQDWQKRGVGGRVDSVDTAAGNVSLSIPSLAAKKSLVVHTTKNTVVYRYAPDSPKPEDAKPSTLQEIQPGDQLRARGNRNAEGTEMTAEEIFAGVFPQFAGTVKSIDANAGTLSVLDLATKNTVKVKVTDGSQLHKIPADMARMFAMRLKGTMPPGTPGAPMKQDSGATSSTTPQSGPTERSAAGGARSGPPDLQRILSRLPASSLADLNLQKGDAVIILATQGTPAEGRTAITLLSGVEPILQASPGAGQAMMLTPWSLGGTPGGDASQ